MARGESEAKSHRRGDIFADAAGPTQMEQLFASDFAGNRLRRPGSYIVCFAAQWCSFCRSFLPQFALLEPGTRSTLAMADVSDEASPLWADLELEVVPMVAGYSIGRILWRVDSTLGVGLGSHDLVRIRELDVAAHGP